MVDENRRQQREPVNEPYPSEARTTSKTLILFQSELDKKANKEWVEAKLEALTKDEAETRLIALSAKRSAQSPHVCSQTKTIEKLTAFMENVKTVKFVSIIGLAIVVGGVVYQAKIQADRNDKTSVVVGEVKESVTQIKSDVNSIKVIRANNTQENQAAQRAQMDELVNQIKEVLEVKNNQRRKKK